MNSSAYPALAVTAAPLAAVQIPLGLVVVGMLLASLAFWASKLDQQSLYGNAWQFARYPADIYAKPLRFLFTYVLPLALIATVPAQALVRPFDPGVVLLALATSATS